MKKVLCLLFITALVAQICAMPGGKGGDKKDPKDKAADEAKKDKDKADKIKDKAEDAAKDTEKKAKGEADDIKKGAKGGEDEAEKAFHHKPKHGSKKPGVFEGAAKKGEEVVDGCASELDSIFGF